MKQCGWMFGIRFNSSCVFTVIIYILPLFRLIEAGFYELDGINVTCVCSCKHCYYVFDDEKDNRGAVATFCSNQNAEPLAFIDVEEFNFVRSWLKRNFLDDAKAQNNELFVWFHRGKKVESWTKLEPCNSCSGWTFTILNGTNDYNFSLVDDVMYKAKFICQDNTSCISKGNCRELPKLNKDCDNSTAVNNFTSNPLSSSSTTLPTTVYNIKTTTEPLTLSSDLSTTTTASNIKITSTSEILSTFTPNYVITRITSEASTDFVTLPSQTSTNTWTIPDCDGKNHTDEVCIPKLTDPVNNDSSMSEGRLEFLLNKLPSIHSALNESINDDSIKRVVSVYSEILHENNTHVWQSMNKDAMLEHVTNLTNLMESHTEWLCQLNGQRNFSEVTDSLSVRFEVNNLTHFESSTFLWRSKTTAGWQVKVKFPQKIQSKYSNETFALVGTLYTTLHTLLQDSQWKVMSPVFSLKLASKSGDVREFVDGAVVLTLPKLGYHSLQCGFWNYTEWVVEGCTSDSNESHVNCFCNHLTSFALLMNVKDEYHRTDVEFYLTITCGSISVICELITVFIFQYFKSLWTLRATITKNLCITLSLGTLFLIIGSEATEGNSTCVFVAIGRHYFFLSAFIWMATEGYHLYLLLVRVFQTKYSHKIRYYLIGYGFPAVFVSISVGLNFSGYKTGKYCWLQTTNNFHWVFLGPVFLIIMINTIFLILAVRSALRVSAFKDEKTPTKFWRYLRGAVSLTTLLGITWTVGYFNFLDESKTVTYIFIILNGLQGLFIFVFHCLINDHVQQVIRKKIFAKNQSFSTRKINVSKTKSVSMKTQSTYDESQFDNKLTPVEHSSPSANNALFSVSLNKHLLY